MQPYPYNAQRPDTILDDNQDEGMSCHDQLPTRAKGKNNSFHGAHQKGAQEQVSNSVWARLSWFIQRWKEKGSAYWKQIKNGIWWKWKKIPPSKGFTGQQRPTKELDKAILEIRRQRVIQKIRILKFTIVPFSVPKKDSIESRTILDLSTLNDFIESNSFKILIMKDIKLLLPKEISISKGLRKYLGFKYKGIYWAFRVMPFGLNIASRIFTKIIANSGESKYMVPSVYHIWMTSS